MRDIHVNTFQGGMQKDLGNTIPQEGSYNDAQNIRIVSDGSEGQSAVIVNVQGNENKVQIEQSVRLPGIADDGSYIYSEVLPVSIIGHVLLRNTVVLFGNVGGGIGVIVALNLITFDQDLIYDNPDLNFSVQNPIQAVARYESEEVQRVYWSDDRNPVRTINIKNLNNLALDPSELNLDTEISFSSPEILEVNFDGGLPAGMYQYAYRLKTEEGVVTRFSPLSGFVHVVSGSAYWDYQEDPENQTEYGNTTPGEVTDKSVVVQLKQLDLDYDYIELAAVHRTNVDSVASVYIVKSARLTSSEEIIKHTTPIGVPVLIEEVTAIVDLPSRAKTIAAKDNRLFLGGLSYSPFNLEFDARAYRYKRSDLVKYPRLSLEDTLGVNADDFQTYSEDEDAINPYNDVSSKFISADNTFKFRKDGVTLGGEGVNVRYKFIKKRLSGNEKYEIPDQSPFVKSSFRSAGCNSEGDELKPGDYKSPKNAAEFVGYQRDEVYRFGIVLYDLKGNPGFVNWVGDIRFPSYEDFDIDGNSSEHGSIYNFILAQNGATKSGANYKFDNNGIANAYQNIGDSGDEYEQILSSYDHENYNINNGAEGNLIALGIRFIVKIPDEIAGEVSGYRVVRVERQQEDKSILGTGIINFIDDFTRGSELYDTNLYQFFNTKQAHSVKIVGDNITPLGYRTRAIGLSIEDSDTTNYNEIERYKLTIDSPDFPFSNNYPTGNCNYLKIIGAVTGRREDNFNSLNSGSASIFSSHKLGPTELSLNRVFDIRYSTKLDQGESLVIPGYDTGGVENMGVFNTCVYPEFGVGDALTDVGIGEETLFVLLSKELPEGNPYSPSDLDFDDPGLFYEDWLLSEEGVGNLGVDGKAKLLGSIKTTLDNQYGGNTALDRKNNSYIPAGPFINTTIDNNDLLSPLDGGFNSHDVWGGDTYVVMYDLEKIRRHDTDLDDGTGAGSNRKTVNFAFPVESSFNTTLRGGWHFANKSDWETDSATLLNTFDLESCYSSSNNTEVFIPKPENFREVSEYSSRIIYSDAKINGSLVDGWRKYKVENYRDLDGGLGDLNALVLNNDIMYFLQNYGFGRLSINPVSTVLDEGGTAIVLGTGSVIQDAAYISSSIGCQSQSAVIDSPRGVYWFDLNTKKAYGFRANGLESISDTHGVKSWFNNIPEVTTPATPKIVLGYDYINNEVLYSVLEEIIVDPSRPSIYNGSTMVFSELINKFTSIYPYYTRMHMSFPDKLFSIKNGGDVYQHNVGSVGAWYGETTDSYVEFTVNKNPLESKVFDNLEWYSEGGSVGQDLFETAEFAASNQFAFVDFNNDQSVDYFPYKRVKENLTKTPIPRNSSAGRFRDTYLKVKLITSNTSKVALHYVKTLFRISRR